MSPSGKSTPTMSAIQCIVFDLDDTLYLERDYAFSGFDAVAERFADEIGAEFDVAARCRELFDTDDRTRVFTAILREAGTPEPDALLPKLINAFRNHAPRIALCSDADEALTRLAERYKLALISDGYLAAQRAKVKALGLASRIEMIILTDQWGREFWKPHPRAFETVANHFNVDHRDCVYVADNPTKDFVAPDALGWTTVMIRREQGIHHDARSATATAQNEHGVSAARHIIRSLDELDAELSR